LEILPTLTCYEIKDYRNEAVVEKGIRTAVMSKQYSNEDFLARLIAKACGKSISLQIVLDQCIIMFFIGY
jgi:T-complex protein 1 subunit theta